MATLEYTIPVELKEAIQRIADKSMKLVDGVVSLDRATKRPKKNVQYTAV